MYATIGAEASDGFDAFSRSYTMSSRAVHYLWFGLVSLTYGAFVTTFISLVASLVVYLSAAGVASDWGGRNGSHCCSGRPSPSEDRPSSATFPAATSARTLVAGAWLQVVGLLWPDLPEAFSGRQPP